MTTYTGPLASPIVGTIAAFARQRGLPCTVAMTYQPGAVPLVIDVRWKEIDRGFTITEDESIATLTDREMERLVAKDIGRMLHPPKRSAFKKRGR